MEPGRDRTLAFVLRVGACCVLVAGSVALWAVARGDFDRTDGRIILTSIGFGVFSAFAASGAALAGRPERPWRVVVGVGGVLASIAAFGLLTVALWFPDPADSLWRAWAVAGLVALWCWHAGAILGPRRADDGQALVVVSATAVAALGLDALGAIAAVTEWLGRPRDPVLVQAFATVLVVAVVASVLVPLLRRLQRTGAPVAASTRGPGAVSAAAAAAPPPAAAPTSVASLGWQSRRPSQALAASWREGDVLTRALLVAGAVAPVLAGIAVALAWPGSPAPATTRTVTVASPPMTVTQVPPAPTPGAPAGGDDFSAADGAAIIARRRRRFDTQAMRSAAALAPIVERCFARSEDFTICDTAPELPGAAAAGLSFGMADAQVAVVASTVATYEIAARSRTATTFTITRDASGALRRTCTPAGAGGCGRNGTW